MDLADVRILVDRNHPSRGIRKRFDVQIGVHLLDVPVAARVAGSRPTPGAGGRNATLVPFWFRANRRMDTRWITWIPVDEGSGPQPETSPGRSAAVP